MDLRHQSTMRTRYHLVTMPLVAIAASAACAKSAPSTEIKPSGSATSQGDAQMTRETLSEQLRKLDESKVPALAASLIAAARDAPRSAIELSQGQDEALASKADQLLLSLEELAIIPMVDAPDPPAVEGRVFLIKQAVEAELALRRKIIARLDKLLDDTTPVPRRTSSRAERKPPAHRVCDEAYLLMRQIVHLGESPVDADVQADIFLNSPEGLKDEQIKKARASGIWNRAITGKDVNDYDDSHPDPPHHPPKR